MRFFLLAAFLLSFLFLVGFFVYIFMAHMGAPLIVTIPTIILVVSLLAMFVVGD